MTHARQGRWRRTVVLGGILASAIGVGLAAQAAKPKPTPAEAITHTFARVNQDILDMAEDWPADKYDFRLDAKANPPVRSFGEVLVHILSGNVYAAKAGKGENVEWTEVKPETLKGKAAIVAALKKSIDDANATLKATPPAQFSKTLSPWLSVLEHDAEHYGQLIAYYRANSVVPPSSRPKK